MYLTTSGLVLRETNYRESDKILTVLTQAEGKITVAARGARRKSSRVAAASQLLAYSELMLFERGGRWSLNEAATIELFPGVRADIEKLCLASYFAELLECCAPEGVAEEELLSLALNSLFVLSEGKKEQELVKAVFETRLMCLVGYEPTLEFAHSPEDGDEEDCLLVLSDGSLAEKGAAAGCAELHGGALSAMRHIAGCEPGRIFSFRLGEMSMKSLSEASEKYLLTQLDRGFKTLDFWKQIKT